MTYLAPRQGLFAIIILISFFIHTTLLLISTDQQLDELKMQTGERMLVQLIEEVKLPLLSKDKVSLSVLTGRYTSENNVASLTIKDIDGDVVLQTGQAQLLTGDVISQKVILSDNVIGEVLLTLRDTSNGEIIASQWLFILGSFITHLLIWLLYGYIARPTRAQLAALSRDVQDHLISHQRINVKRTRHNDPAFDTQTLDTGSEGRIDEVGQPLSETVDNVASENSRSRASGLNINQAVNQYVQSHQGDDTHTQSDEESSKETNRGTSRMDRTVNQQKGRFRDYFSRSASQDSNATNESVQMDQSLNKNLNGSLYKSSDKSLDKPLDVKLDKSTVTSAAQNSALGQETTNDSAIGTRRRPLLANRLIDKAVVQIEFIDPHNLLATLAPEQAHPYFTLCTQLLQRTLTELLKQPILHGIKVSIINDFDANGAQVEFYADNNHSKAGLAAMMFAKVYMMLHEITCLKLRQLGRYSADIYVGVSDNTVTQQMQQVLHNNAKAHDIYALLPATGVKQLSGHMQLNSLPKPTTVYERDCAYLAGVSETMMQRLVDVRNVVLLSAQ